jgi:hypothetical protein
MTLGNFTALSKRFDSNKTELLAYKKGTFIIPFSGKHFTDATTISIILDYNQTHELENQSSFNNEVYFLEEEVNINCSKLTEPKIAQHFEKSVRYSWPSYLQIAEDDGFLTYELLIEGETEKVLNNNDFNVFIWPYLPGVAKNYETFMTFMNIKMINTIRQFVNNGGGFIGTCYGAYAASSGFIIPGIFFSLKYANNPDFDKPFPAFSLSISDSIMKINSEAFSNLYITKHKVVNINHPVFYGVNETFLDFFEGPIFVWLGKNTHPLTVFYEVKPLNNNDSISDKLKKILINRTSWVNSTFGKGKIVLYGSHPDFVNNIKPLFNENQWDGDKFYGRRIIHNSIFFVLSEDNPEFSYTSYNVSFINRIINNTNNLSINNSEKNEFEELEKKLGEIFNKIIILKNLSIDLKALFLSIENKSNNFAENIKMLNYTFWLSEIYLDYINKTRFSIDMLKRVLPLLYKYDDSLTDKVKMKKIELENLLNESKKIIQKTTIKLNFMKENLVNYKIYFLKKFLILEQGRNILQSFEKCLKYLPKVYFEILKLLKYSWYNYEAYIALSDFLKIDN